MTEYTTPLCKSGEGSRKEQWPVLAIFMLMLAAAAIYLLIDSVHSVPKLLFSLPFIVFCSVFSLGCFLEMEHLLSWIRITPRGVTVISPFSPAQELVWSDFRQVCICLYNRRMGEIHGEGHPQLVFVRPGAKKNLFDRWKTHSAFQHRNLIVIDYDAALHEAVRELCPLQIVDLRDTPPYQ